MTRSTGTSGGEGDDGRAVCNRRAGQVMAAVAFLLLTFVGLFVRYQLIGAYEIDRFVEPAFFQRYRGVPIALSRGNIVDRHGTPLHYPTWTSAIVQFSDNGTSLLDFPRKIARNVDEAHITEILRGGRDNGLWVVPEETRYGPLSIARHVVGHVRANAYISPSDNVGESGLEKWFQSTLAGGYPASAGIVLTGEGSGLPGSGVRIAPPQNMPNDLFTTLDASVQRAVEDALDSAGVESGAAVVLDVATGEILAMASRPEFDQNHPERSLDDPSSPFVNRAVSAFPPGSAWKPVVVALALEKGLIDENSTFLCDGEVEIGGRTISCGSREEGHGEVTIKEAVAHSCNSALIQLALKLSSRDLVEFARSTFFGVPTGIELPGEASGVLPDPYLMYAGDVANFSIGQGYLSVTPLQVAAFFRAIASGGEWRSPELIVGAEQEVCRLFSLGTAKVLQEALLLAARQGTGREAYVPVYGCAGKTGTAETGLPSGTSHAWFSGWAPVIAPKYAVTVFVEEGGDGPGVAAPIFRDIVERIIPR